MLVGVFCCTGRRNYCHGLLSPRHNTAHHPHQTDVCYRRDRTVISIYFHRHVGTVAADSRRRSLFLPPQPLTSHPPPPPSPLPPPNPLRHKSRQRTKCRERLGLTSRENWKARQGKPKNKTKKTTTSSSNLQVYPTRDGEKKKIFSTGSRGSVVLGSVTETQFERCLAPRLSLPPTPWPAIKWGCLKPVNWVFLTIVVFDQCNDKQTS